jgi:hypothetical protein
MKTRGIYCLSLFASFVEDHIDDFRHACRKLGAIMSWSASITPMRTRLLHLLTISWQSRRDSWQVHQSRSDAGAPISTKSWSSHVYISNQVFVETALDCLISRWIDLYLVIIIFFESMKYTYTLLDCFDVQKHTSIPVVVTAPAHRCALLFYPKVIWNEHEHHTILLSPSHDTWHFDCRSSIPLDVTRTLQHKVQQQKSNSSFRSLILLCNPNVWCRSFKIDR